MWMWDTKAHKRSTRIITRNVVWPTVSTYTHTHTLANTYVNMLRLLSATIPALHTHSFAHEHTNYKNQIENEMRTATTNKMARNCFWSCGGHQLSLSAQRAQCRCTLSVLSVHALWVSLCTSVSASDCDCVGEVELKLERASKREWVSERASEHAFIYIDC